MRQNRKTTLSPFSYKIPFAPLLMMAFLCCSSQIGCHGRYGSKGQLCRWWGSVQARYSHLEIPDWARNYHQLVSSSIQDFHEKFSKCYILWEINYFKGWHGEDLASHLLQWTPSCTRGTPNCNYILTLFLHIYKCETRLKYDFLMYLIYSSSLKLLSTQKPTGKRWLKSCLKLSTGNWIPNFSQFPNFCKLRFNKPF